MKHVLNYLDPIYAFLPYCAHVEVEIDPKTKQKIIHTTRLKTYPAFPWKIDTGCHAGEDPIEFIEICAKNGLVHWETEEERKARLKRANET